MGNYLQFRDYFKFDMVKPTAQFQDDYAGAFKPDLPGPGVPTSSMSQDTGSGLYVRMAATHAGVIINNRMYRPDKMRDGTNSFLDPHPKPILLHHKSVPNMMSGDVSDPIGRVVDARYIDSSNSLRDMLNSDKSGISDAQIKRLDKVQQFVAGKLPLKDAIDVAGWLINDATAGMDDYAGLGHIELTMRITDPDAVQKFADGRYLTGSVGAKTDAAICSICKQDWVVDGFCEHEPGMKYDDILCFMITGNLKYGEYSIVNMPADPYSQVLELSVDGNVQHRQLQNAEDSESVIYQVPLQLLKYNKEETNMKTVLDSQDQTQESELTQPADVSTETPDTQDSQEEPTGAEDAQDSEVEAAPAMEDAPNAEDSEEESVDDSDADEGGVQSAEDSEEEDSGPGAKELFDKLAEDGQLSDDDRYALYLLMTADFVDGEAEVDWDKLSEEMEQYSEDLEGEDELLGDAKAQDKPGGSNAGKYNKSDGPFCGPSGGAPKGTYPVGTKKRAKAALAYARNAPKPQGIRDCVCRHWPELPSCKDDKKDSQDSVRLTKEELLALPRSRFCGPAKTVPVTDLSHYYAAKEMLKDLELEGKDQVMENIERKGRALGAPKEVPVEDSALAPEFVVDEALRVEDFTSEQLLVIMDHIKSSIGDTDCGCADAEDLQKENDLLMQEIQDLETQLGDLHDKLAVLQMQYEASLHDVHHQQDHELDEKVQVKQLKARYLQLLSAVTDKEVKDLDELSQLGEDVLDTSIQAVEGTVDIREISLKLDDGMTRTPEGESVENPIADGSAEGNADDAIQLDSKMLTHIENQYHKILYTKGAVAARDYIARLQKQGKLPKGTKEE